MASAATCACGLLGLLLSLYALYVEHEATHNPGYRAWCDNRWMACTRVFTSEYGHLVLGVSNAAWGVGFYSAIYVLGFTNRVTLTLALSAAACLASVGLAYLLTAVLGDFCPVCAMMYAVNSALLLLSLRRHRRLLPLSRTDPPRPKAV